MKNKILLFLDIMYYNNYCLYNTLLANISPSIQPSIILGAIIGFPFAMIIDNLYIYNFCKVPSAWIFISCCFSCIFIIYYIYDVNNRKLKAIENKPFFLANGKMNSLLVLFIYIITIGSLFYMVPIGEYILKSC